jgi:hypothetical protein
MGRLYRFEIGYRRQQDSWVESHPFVPFGLELIDRVHARPKNVGLGVTHERVFLRNLLRFP